MPIDAVRARVIGTLIAMGWAITAPATAQLADLSPFATVEARYDNNVFRVADAAEARAQSPTGDPRMGDSLTQATVGVTGEFNPGIQQVIATAQVTRAVYRHFDRLDYNAYRAVAGWAWQYRRLADGEIGMDIQRDLQDYGGSDDSDAAFTLTREYRAGGGINITPRWRGELALLANSRRTTDVEDTFFDLDELTVDIAGFYLGDPVARLGVGLAHTSGEYPRRDSSANAVLADAYDETTLDLRLAYSPSGISSLDAALGYTRTRQRPVRDRDVGGITGRLQYRRQISGRTATTLRAYRRVRPAEFENANLVVDSGVVVAVDWSYSVKTNVTAEFERRRLDYRDQGDLGATTEAREDDQFVGRLEVAWQPLERLGVVLTAESEDLNSNQDDERYDVSLVSLSVRVGY